MIIDVGQATRNNLTHNKRHVARTDVVAALRYAERWGWVREIEVAPSARGKAGSSGRQKLQFQLHPDAAGTMSNRGENNETCKANGEL